MFEHTTIPGQKKADINASLVLLTNNNSLSGGLIFASELCRASDHCKYTNINIKSSIFF